MLNSAFQVPSPLSSCGIKPRGRQECAQSSRKIRLAKRQTAEGAFWAWRSAEQRTAESQDEEALSTPSDKLGEVTSLGARAKAKRMHPLADDSPCSNPLECAPRCTLTCEVHAFSTAWFPSCRATCTLLHALRASLGPSNRDKPLAAPGRLAPKPYLVRWTAL